MEPGMSTVAPACASARGPPRALAAAPRAEAALAQARGDAEAAAKEAAARLDESRRNQRRSRPFGGPTLCARDAPPRARSSSTRMRSPRQRARHRQRLRGCWGGWLRCRRRPRRIDRGRPARSGSRIWRSSRRRGIPLGVLLADGRVQGPQQHRHFLDRSSYDGPGALDVVIWAFQHVDPDRSVLGAGPGCSRQNVSCDWPLAWYSRTYFIFRSMLKVGMPTRLPSGMPGVPHGATDSGLATRRRPASPMDTRPRVRLQQVDCRPPRTAEPDGEVCRKPHPRRAEEPKSPGDVPGGRHERRRFSGICDSVLVLFRQTQGMEVSDGDEQVRGCSEGSGNTQASGSR